MIKSVIRLAYSLLRLYWRIMNPVTLGVRVVLIKDGKALLVKHTYMRDWYLAGGAVKRNETLEQTARREAWEEVGAQLGELSLLGAYTSFREGKSDHIIVFACDDFTLTDHVSHEIKQQQLFALDYLPKDLAPGHERRIKEYLSGSGVLNYGAW